MEVKSDKHAFLIMAHHRIDILKLLLESLDYDNNDIYLHMDSKCKDDLDSLVVSHAKLFFLERKDVRWGGYSQIDCELNLIEEALKHEKYQYLHLLTGVSFPIKSNEYIHDFFKNNYGYEFVGFDNNRDYSNRLKYKFLFNEIGKVNSLSKKVLFTIRRAGNFFQKFVKIDKFKKYNMTCKKGFVYWSITDRFAQYLIDNRETIKGMCKDSICGDEVFVQTMLYNSNFKNKIYNYDDEFSGCMRVCPWETSEIGYRKDYNFEIDDIDFLLNSKYLFALKFDSKDSLEIVKKILSRIKQ